MSDLYSEEAEPGKQNPESSLTLVGEESAIQQDVDIPPPSNHSRDRLINNEHPRYHGGGTEAEVQVGPTPGPLERGRFNRATEQKGSNKENVDTGGRTLKTVPAAQALQEVGQPREHHGGRGEAPPPTDTTGYATSGTEGPKPKSIKFLVLNVCGLVSKLERSRQLEQHVKNYDIICLSETKMKKCDEPDASIPGYTPLFHHRQTSTKVRSGGIAMYAKNSVFNHITQLNGTGAEHECALWCKLDRCVLGYEIIIGSTYIPPIGSKYFKGDVFIELEEEITNLQKEFGIPLLLVGDFNARTGLLPDSIDIEPCIIHSVGSQDLQANSFNSEENLRSMGIDPTRYNRDEIINGHGKRFIDLCRSNNLLIANGRVGEDNKTGSLTCKRVSVVDYIVASPILFQHMRNMKVDTFDSDLSDVHNPLSVELSGKDDNLKCQSTGNGPGHTPETTSDIDTPPDNDGKNGFMKSFDMNAVDQISSCIDQALEAAETSCSRVDDITEMIRKLCAYAGTNTGINKRKRDNIRIDDCRKNESPREDPIDQRHEGSHHLGPLDKLFSGKEFKACLKELKNGKTRGIDRAAYAFLSKGPEQVLSLIVQYFNMLLILGTMPTVWKTVPNMGSPKDTDNHKGVTLLSCLCKVFTSLINQRLCSYLDVNKVLVEEQKGFSYEYATTEHIHTLHLLIDYFKSQSKRLYCAFIEYKQAPDPANRRHVWSKLLAFGITGKVFDVIMNLYTSIKSSPLFELFDCNAGVQEGGSIHPLLFSIYLNDLKTHLQQEFKGINIEHTVKNLCTLDTILLSESPDELQIALNSLYGYCQNCKIAVDICKTKVVVFARGKARKVPDWHFGQYKIGRSGEYTYSGVIFNYNGSLSKSVAKQSTQARMMKYWLTRNVREIHRPFDDECCRFDSYVLPILLYGSELWGFEDSSSQFDVFHTQAGKSIRDVEGSGSNSMTLGELGRVRIQHHINQRMLNYWARLVNGRGDETVFSIYSLLKKLHVEKSYKSKWIDKIHDELKHLGLSDLWQQRESLTSYGSRERSA